MLLGEISKKRTDLILPDRAQISAFGSNLKWEEQRRALVAAAIAAGKTAEKIQEINDLFDALKNKSALQIKPPSFTATVIRWAEDSDEVFERGIKPARKRQPEKSYGFGRRMEQLLDSLMR